MEGKTYEENRLAFPYNPVGLWSARFSGPTKKPTVTDLLRELEKDLATGKPEVRKAALKEIDKAIEQMQAFVVRDLCALSRSNDEETRIEAVRTIGKLRPLPSDIVLTALTRALEKDESPKVRRAAATALGSLSVHNKVGVKELLKAAKEDGDYHVRMSSMYALGRFGPAGKPAVPLMMETLEKHRDSVEAADSEQARIAAEALGLVGPEAAPAVPTLLKCLDAKNENVRKQAIYALGRIGRGHKDVLPTLRRLLTEKEPQLKWNKESAMVALELMGPDAKEAVPDLLAVLRAADFRLKDAPAGIMLALAKIDPAAEGVVPAIVAVMRNESALREHRNLAIGVLKDMMPVAKSAAPALVATFKEAVDTNELSVENIWKALIEAGADAVPPLVDLLGESKSAMLRRYVIGILGGIGPSAKTAVPAIRKCLQDSDEAVRDSAERALQRIEKKI